MQVAAVKQYSHDAEMTKTEKDGVFMHIAEAEQTKRDLRQRIGRLRRQIDGRVREVHRARSTLTSWSGLLGQHPGWVVLALSVASSPAIRSRLARIVESRVIERVFDRITATLWQQIRDLWRDVIRPYLDQWRGDEEEKARQDDAGDGNEHF